MRQIQLREYSCPICNADLHQIGVDFSYRQDKGEETKTTYQCQGCNERFCSVENAHVEMRVGVTPEFACRFCGKQCSYLSLADDWSDYFRCLPCRVSYERRYSPGFPDVQTINMYTELNGNLYVMRQFIDQNRTRVEMLPSDIEDTVVIAQEFSFLIPNITPSNIQEKLLTYLIFS
jgi:hypothetical protein